MSEETSSSLSLGRKTQSRDIVDFRDIEKSTINRMKKLLLILILLPFFGLSQKACNVFGKVKFVEYGEDKVGNWKVVDYGEDFKAKEVEYGEGCN